MSQHNKDSRSPEYRSEQSTVYAQFATPSRNKAQCAAEDKQTLGKSKKNSERDELQRWRMQAGLKVAIN